MSIQTLNEIQQAIERLPAGARISLERWFYAHPFRYGDLEFINHVAAPATAYKVAHKRMSCDEYLEFEKSDPAKHEYVAGEVFAMWGPSKRHGLICGNLFSAFVHHLKGGPCQTFIGNFKVRIRVGLDDYFYYPDIMVACGPGGLEDFYLEDPKLVIEVLSPSTERTDRHEKVSIYQRIPTLEEYALIAQDVPDVVVCRRSENWRPRKFESPEALVEFGSIGLALPLLRIYDGAFQTDDPDLK